MNKQILIVNIHSILDIITNSSSELFVCDTKKSLKFIKQFLMDALALYCRGIEQPREFEDCFGDIYKITEKNVDEVINIAVVDYLYYHWRWHALGIALLKGAYDFEQEYKTKYNLVERYPYAESEQHNDRIRKKVKTAYKVYLRDWKINNLDKLRKQLIGSILIPSRKTNSIPYPLFNLIETVFNAGRVHLG